MKSLLSKEAIRVLEDNSYKFIQGEDLIVFKRAKEYTTIIVIGGLFFFVALVLFIFSTLFGILTLLLGAAAIFVKVRYFTKKMDFIVNLKTLKFDFYDNEIDLDQQSLSFASKIILHSKFVASYASADKSTNEEHRITINIKLLSGSTFTLFAFHSDYSEPSDEIVEIYELIKKLIRWTKAKDQESKLPASES